MSVDINRLVKLKSLKPVYDNEINRMINIENDIEDIKTKLTNIGDIDSIVDKTITSANLPNAKTIGYYAFHNCSLLTEINAPKAEYVDGMAFYGTAIKKMYFPNVTTFDQHAFAYCRIETIIFDNLTTIPSMGFALAYQLKSVLIKTNSVCTIESTSIFSSSASAKVYVPDNLVENYKNATNWVTFADRIKPLSEYVEV